MPGAALAGNISPAIYELRAALGANRDDLLGSTETHPQTPRPVPSGDGALAEMKARLASEASQALYRQRSQTSRGVFADRHASGSIACRRVPLQPASEWSLINTAANLDKVRQALTGPPPPSPDRSTPPR